MTKDRFALPPVRLYALAPWFAWIMCLFLAPARDLQGLLYGAIEVGANPLFVLVLGHVLFLAGCSAGLAAAIVAERRGATLGSGGRHALLGCALGAAGTLLAKTGLGFDPAAWAAVSLVGYAFAGLGCALCYVAFGRLYGSVGVKSSMVAVPLSAAAGALAYLLYAVLPAQASVALACLLPVACGAFLWVSDESRWAAQSPQTTSDNTVSTPVPELRTVQNTQFTKWRITLQIAVYWFSFGAMWTLAAATLPRSVSQNLLFCASAAALVVVLAATIVISNYVFRKSTVKTFWLFVPLVVVAVASVAIFGEGVQPAAFAMLFAARLIAEVQLIVHFSALGRKNGYPTTLLFGRGFGSLVLAEALGVLAGIPLAALSVEWLSIALLLVLSAAVTVLIVSILRVNNTLQRNELAQALARAEAKATETASLGFEALAQQLAQAHGFSARETEVAALLLAGRSAPYIAERLTVGLSTVNTHVKHIYEKAGVHTRQELIDLGERERGRLS